MINRAIDIAKNEGFLTLTKRSVDFIRYKLGEVSRRMILPYAIWKIGRVKFNSLQEIVDFSFEELFGLIKPIQIKEEILELLKLLSEKKPEVILEIGTANGGTLFLFSRVASENSIIISVDLPGGRFGGGYPDWKIPLYKSFALFNQKIYLIRADSHSPATLDTISKILNGKKVDFLFIDGDHSYEGVRKDFEMYHPLVEENGIIAFHDIVPGPEECVGGVPKFWQELKNKFSYKEIVKSSDQGGYGIGIIYKNSVNKS